MSVHFTTTIYRRRLSCCKKNTPQPQLCIRITSMASNGFFLMLTSQVILTLAKTCQLDVFDVFFFTGFDATAALEGCCGNDGPSLNDSSTDGCGSLNVAVCSNADRYINWDGVHFTQKAHSVLASWVVAGLIPELSCAVGAKYYQGDCLKFESLNQINIC